MYSFYNLPKLLFAFLKNVHKNSVLFSFLRLLISFFLLFFDFSHIGNEKSLKISKDIFKDFSQPKKTVYPNNYCALCHTLVSSRYCPDVTPVYFLNTRLKFCTELKPHRKPISRIGSLVARKSCLAFSTRYSAR